MEFKYTYMSFTGVLG